MVLNGKVNLSNNGQKPEEPSPWSLSRFGDSCSTPLIEKEYPVVNAHTLCIFLKARKGWTIITFWDNFINFLTNSRNVCIKCKRSLEVKLNIFGLV